MRVTCVYVCMHVYSMSVNITRPYCLSQPQYFVQGSTLDATMELLCAVVRGIIQREDQFVFKLQVVVEQVSRLVELEDIAKDKCAVTRTESRWGPGTVTFLELKPLCEYP